MGTFNQQSGDKSYCWQCKIYERGLDEPYPPHVDEKHYCSVKGRPMGAYGNICLAGNRDKERWQRYLEVTSGSGQAETCSTESTKGPHRGPETKPPLESFPEPLQRCVSACNPGSAFYIKMRETRLTETEIEVLVTERYLNRYIDKTGRVFYRLAGPYHYLVPREDKD